jgi:hypothetical protein
MCAMLQAFVLCGSNDDVLIRPATPRIVAFPRSIASAAPSHRRRHRPPRYPCRRGRPSAHSPLRHAAAAAPSRTSRTPRTAPPAQRGTSTRDDRSNIRAISSRLPPAPPSRARRQEVGGHVDDLRYHDPAAAPTAPMIRMTPSRPPVVNTNAIPTTNTTPHKANGRRTIRRRLCQVAAGQLRNAARPGPSFVRRSGIA